MADIHPSSLEAELARHAAQNEALGRALEEENVPLGLPRIVDLTFLSGNKTAAVALQAALAEAGFPDAKAHRSDSGKGRWNVEVSLSLAPDLVLSAPFTEKLVRLARACESRYDGWGTDISDCGPL
jgi:hypothetical protein